MTYFTDTHCHIDFDRFDKDRAEVLDRAWEAGLAWILNPGIDIETSKAAIDLSKSNPGKINAAVGIHPNYGKAWSADLLEELREISQEPEVVAIGEIGLDYYREHTPHDQQRKMFEAQLSLAEERGLPIVIHNRESTQDLLDILRSWIEGLRQSNNPL
ncbi:MAG TPA: TatD family hydrolase, partial [Brevefilum sp.]